MNNFQDISDLFNVPSIPFRQVYKVPGIEYGREYHLPSGVNKTYHCHEWYEILFLIEGDVAYEIEGRLYPLVPGDMLVINDREFHTNIIGTNKPFHRIYIHLDPVFFHMFGSGSGGLLSPFEQRETGSDNLVSQFPPALSSLRDMDLSGGISPDFQRPFIDLLYALYGYSKKYKDTAVEKKTRDEKMSRLISYINGNPSKDLSIDNLGIKFGLSRSRLIVRFKNFTGLPIHEYILRKRVNHARVLLVNGSSATEACFTAGFKDYSHFYRTFKKRMRCSPGEFLKNGKAAPNGAA